VIGRWSILRFHWAFPAKPISPEPSGRRQVTHPADIVKRLDPTTGIFADRCQAITSDFGLNLHVAGPLGGVTSNK
jgi:hypothetical protein